MKKKLQLISQKYKKIIEDYYKQLHTNKVETLKEIVKFLDIYSLPK
jgi:hypothetical protein